MITDFNCTANPNYFYSYGMVEIQGILEDTITQVLSNARLCAFQAQYHYIIENDIATNLLQTELVLKDSVESYPEAREKQDLKRISSHYRALATKRFINFQKIYQKYCTKIMQNQQNSNFACIGENLESIMLQGMEFGKINQYFLQFELQFVSLNRAMYDRTGSTCLLKFKIVPRP